MHLVSGTHCICSAKLGFSQPFAPGKVESHFSAKHFAFIIKKFADFARWNSRVEAQCFKYQKCLIAKVVKDNYSFRFVSFLTKFENQIFTIAIDCIQNDTYSVKLLAHFQGY